MGNPFGVSGQPLRPAVIERAKNIVIRRARRTEPVVTGTQKSGADLEARSSETSLASKLLERGKLLGASFIAASELTTG